MIAALKKEIKGKKVDIVRMALQSAIAAFITYVIIFPFRPEEAFLAILSSVFILNANIGGTLNSAKNRLLSTLLGSALGLLTVWILPFGWGTGVALIISMLILNAIAAVKSDWRYGVVAAIAVSLGAEENAFAISSDRLIAIGIGAAVGILVSFIILPEKAEARAKRFLGKAIQNINARFSIAMQNTHLDEVKSSKKPRQRFHTNLSNAKDSMANIRFYDTENLRKCIDAVEKTYNSTIILDRIANKTSRGISDDTSGVEKDTEEIRAAISLILTNISLLNFNNDEQLNKLNELTEKIRNEMNYVTDDDEQLHRQHTFIFALCEIQQNLKELNELYEKA